MSHPVRPSSSGRLTGRTTAAGAAAPTEDVLAEADELVGVEDLNQSEEPDLLSSPINDGSGETDDSAPVGNAVRVLVRVRPLLESEYETHSTQLLQIGHNHVQARVTQTNEERTPAHALTTGEISVDVKDQAHGFQFDAVLTPHHTQVDVYEAGKVERMLQALLKGYHSTIFAYGQTGSGKTFTMDGISYASKHVPVGPPPVGDEPQKMKTVRVLREPSVVDSGLSLRCINELFNMIAARQASSDSKHIRYTVKVSFIQIYQESVYDLLSDAAPTYIGRENQSSKEKSSNSIANAGLRIRWNPQREFFVENLYEFECGSSKIARNYFLAGMKKRLVASHKMNASSSRSHAIFTLQVLSKIGAEPETRSTLNLVDLAGSERANLTGATGQVLQQSIGINQSLFVLRKVIKALSALPATSGSNHNKALAHVPYRDSTLTRLLKHSLGGNCLTLMVACINPADAYAEENLSTLNYAALTKKISNQAVRNEDPKTALIRKLRAEIKMLRGLLARANQNIVLGTTSGFVGGDGNLNTGQRQISNGYVDDQQLLAQSDLAEKLIDSVNHMKELIADNHDLRQLYEENASRLEELEFSNATLNQENDELRDRVHFLETVIVDGQGEDVLKSPDELTIDEDEPIESPSKRNQNTRELQFELDDLRAENQRLKSLMIESDFNSTGRLDSNNGFKSSRRDSNRPTSNPPSSSSAAYSTQPQFASTASNYAQPAFAPRTSPPPPPAQPVAPIQPYSSRAGVYSSGGLSSSVANPHINAVYRPNTQSMQTISSLQGRHGRTQQRKGSGKRSSSSAHQQPAAASKDWERSREHEFLQERYDVDGGSGAVRHPQAWDARPAPKTASTSYPMRMTTSIASSSQTRSTSANLLQSALNNPTIANYMQQQLYQRNQPTTTQMTQRRY